MYSSHGTINYSKQKEKGGFRPTTDRAKETLFNVLNNLIDFDGISCLDLFAGSGSIGFEALSRGAAHCDFVDISAKYMKLIERTAKELKVDEQIRLFCYDAMGFLDENKAASYDLIFADPPYQYSDYDLLMNKVFYISFGIFVLEHSSGTELLYDSNRFDIISKTVGAANFRIFSSKE